MKTPRFFNWDDVPRQMVSSAMDDVLSDWSRITSAAANTNRSEVDRALRRAMGASLRDVSLIARRNARSTRNLVTRRGS
ncbi:MAG: hypothetical protein QOJ05_1965 [Verrucomicrobiota bacterium]